MFGVIFRVAAVDTFDVLYRQPAKKRAVKYRFFRVVSIGFCNTTNSVFKLHCVCTVCALSLLAIIIPSVQSIISPWQTRSHGLSIMRQTHIHQSFAWLMRSVAVAAACIRMILDHRHRADHSAIIPHRLQMNCVGLPLYRSENDDADASGRQLAAAVGRAATDHQLQAVRVRWSCGVFLHFMKLSVRYCYFMRTKMRI